ncbi:hypothetical protein KOW79_017360 [Hemibagrus wyckioides]|uniref:Uncharacterized protein n=1 Tax=Hemibagrus wyckioides TaxID=337641 RepID=A0A9D3N9W8_9TELE|nr:hypothetical protein KOW79_017360 [Hemibagrus wyckioides]
MYSDMSGVATPGSITAEDFWYGFTQTRLSLIIKGPSVSAGRCRCSLYFSTEGSSVASLARNTYLVARAHSPRPEERVISG